MNLPVRDALNRVDEACAKLNIKEPTLRRWILLRKVTYVKIGRSVRIPESEINRIIVEGTVKMREPHSNGQPTSEGEGAE